MRSHRHACRAILGIIFLTSCMLGPVNNSEVESRSSTIDFHGLVAEGDQNVVIQARLPSNDDWSDIVTATSNSTHFLTKFDTDLFQWKITTAIPDHLWEAGADGYRTQVRARRLSNAPSSLLTFDSDQGDTRRCLESTDDWNEFVEKCGSPESPVVTIETIDFVPKVQTPDSVRRAEILLPGHTSPKVLPFNIFGDVAIFNGDIEIDELLDDSQPERPPRVIVHEEDVSVGSTRVPLIVKKGPNRRWPGGVIPIEIDDDLVGRPAQTAIQTAVKRYADNTNIRLVPYDSDLHRKRIKFVSKNFTNGACGTSGIGRPGGGVRKIRLRPSASVRCVIHEIGHSLGLYHEHSRMDRDDFITINWDRIRNGQKSNFNKHIRGAIDFGPYDCDSVMHYSSRAFAKPGTTGPTISSRNPVDCLSVGGTKLSDLDKKGLDRLYPGSNCEDGPAIYVDRNLQGRSYMILASSRRLGDDEINMGDKISSLCVPPGWTVTLFKGTNFRTDRRWQEFSPGTYNDLREFNLNNNVSSIRVEGVAANEPPPECDDVPMLFSYDYFRGRRVRLDGDVANLGAKKLKDKATSLCIPAGWTVHMFRKKNFRGTPSVEISAGSDPAVFRDFKNEGPDPLGFWHDKASSVKVNRP